MGQTIQVCHWVRSYHRTTWWRIHVVLRRSPLTKYSYKIVSMNYEDLVRQAREVDMVSVASSRRSSGLGRKSSGSSKVKPRAKPINSGRSSRASSVASQVSTALSMDTTTMKADLRNKIEELKQVMIDQTETRKANTRLLNKKRELETIIVSMLDLAPPPMESEEEDEPIKVENTPRSSLLSSLGKTSSATPIHEPIHETVKNPVVEDIHPDDSISMVSDERGSNAPSKVEIDIGGTTMVFEKTVKYKKLTTTELYDAVKHFFQPTPSQWESFMGYVQSLESEREIIGDVSRMKLGRRKVHRG